MKNLLQRFKKRLILHRHPIAHDLWRQATEHLPVLTGLSAVEKARLRELSTLFLHEKNFTSIEIDLTSIMSVRIAALACLPVLNLGVSLFSAWRTLIVYPNAFVVNRDETDEYGVVHHERKVLSGEAWQRGPVVVSWADLETDLHPDRHGHNVVIHEIAHKLDMINGHSNGMPPLHASMAVSEWTAVFSLAYQHLQQNLEHHHPLHIDAYAATNPAECFAVFSEFFFCAPEVLHSYFPGVYRQLQLYYRQDPLLRGRL
jgi:Mlc titration factor MtfA (ptsG expression regulator)